MDEEKHIWIDGQVNGWSMDIMADRQTDTHTHTHTHRSGRTDRQTDRQRQGDEPEGVYYGYCCMFCLQGTRSKSWPCCTINCWRQNYKCTSRKSVPVFGGPSDQKKHFTTDHTTSHTHINTDIRITAKNGQERSIQVKWLFTEWTNKCYK